MTYLDNLLEECLRDLDRGAPLEKVVQRVPSEAAEILPLLRLAAVTRELPHPSMASNRVRAQRGRIMKFARANAQPERRFSWRFAMAQLSMAMALVVVVLLTIGFTGPQGSRYATLMNVSGMVEVFDGQDWRVATNGERVQAGEKIRTWIDSQATLVFYEGTLSLLAQDTELTLDMVQGGWNRSLRVEMEQASGFSTHSVVPLKGENSRFIVKAALGQVAVHGTVFDVEVIDGSSRFAVQRGVVEVTYAQEQVMLTAGQAAVVSEDGVLDEPSYEFNVQGPIAAISGDAWTVSGLTFLVNPAVSEGHIWQIGDLVQVRGRILADGSLVADWVKRAANDKEKAHFTGLVESTGAEAWLIGGKTVLVDSNTEIEPGLVAGDPVEVSFVILEDGSWLALEIESLAGDDLPDETATATAALTATSTVTLTPTGQATPTLPKAGCEAGDSEQPEGMVLAERYGVPYAEIMNWFCQGYGFGQIDLAYDLARSMGVPVEEIFAMNESGMGWGLIKQTLEPKASKTPDDTKTPKPTSTLKPSKTPEPTKTLKPTSTPKPTDEPKPTKEEKPTDEPKPTKEEKPTDEPKPTKDKDD